MKIAERIEKAIKHSGLSKSGVAKLCGVSASSVSQWLNADTKAPKAENLLRLARVTGVSYTWLVDGKGEMLHVGIDDSGESGGASNVGLGPAFFRHVPEINWVQAGCWTEVDEYSLDLSDVPYWPCPVSCSDNTFALRVEGDSMAPTFMPGTLIFVDPEVMPISGKKVVVILTDTNQATFKQYIEDGGQKMLKAMNPNWPQQYIPINGNCRIVGTVIFAGMEM